MHEKTKLEIIDYIYDEKEGLRSVLMGNILDGTDTREPLRQHSIKHKVGDYVLKASVSSGPGIKLYGSHSIVTENPFIDMQRTPEAAKKYFSETGDYFVDLRMLTRLSKPLTMPNVLMMHLPKDPDYLYLVLGETKPFRHSSRSREIASGPNDTELWSRGLDIVESNLALISLVKYAGNEAS